MIKFISYNGDISLYCDGILTLDIDDVFFKFGNHPSCDFPKFWKSGGGWNTNGEVWTKPWIINKNNKDKVLEEFNKIFDDPYKILNDCLQVINENVPQGCCGDCI